MFSVVSNMKNKKIIKISVLILFATIIIGAAAGYFIYGSTLIDITDEKSISDNLAADPDQPITILATEKNGDYFGILYSDPTDGNQNIYHFNYITKAKLYKNKYHAEGGYSTFTNGSLCVYEANLRDSDRTTSEVFIYRVGKTADSGDTCSVFKYNISESYIVPEEVKDEQEIRDKMEKLAESCKKLDEFDLPDENAFIIAKSYPIDKPDDEITIENKSVSQEEMKQSVLDTIDDAVKDALITEAE